MTVTTFQVALPGYLDSGGNWISPYIYLMTVDTTTPYGTYISNNNTYNTYKITNLTTVFDLTTNLIVTNNGNTGNLLFDPTNLCFVPSNVTSGIPYSVQFYDNGVNGFLYWIPGPFYTTPSTYFFFYSYPNATQYNYFKQLGTSGDGTSLLLTITPAPATTMAAAPAATMASPSTPQTTEQTASMVSKQIKYQYGNKANVKATGPAVTVTSIYGLTEKDFPVTISLPVTQLLPTFTFSEITTKDVYGNEQALDDGLPVATAGFNASMRKRAKLANALAIRDKKTTYSFSIGNVSDIDKYTGLIEGDETSNKAKLVKGYTLDFSNPYAGPETHGWVPLSGALPMTSAGVGITPNYQYQPLPPIPAATLK